MLYNSDMLFCCFSNVEYKHVSHLPLGYFTPFCEEKKNIAFQYWNLIYRKRSNACLQACFKFMHYEQLPHSVMHKKSSTLGLSDLTHWQAQWCLDFIVELGEINEDIGIDWLQQRNIKTQLFLFCLDKIIISLTFGSQIC